MKKPKHFYNLESTPSKSGEQMIFFNLSYGYKESKPSSKTFKYIPLRISTQWSLPKEYWTGKPLYRANQSYTSKFGKSLNSALERIEKICYSQLEIYRNQHDTNPTVSQLKQLVLEKLSRIEKPTNDVVITDFIERTISRRTTLPNTSTEYWKIKTGEQYTNLNNHIKKFEAKSGITLTFGKITEEIYWDFFKTINDIQKVESGTYYKQSTMSKDCKHLRAIFNYANEQDIEIGINYNKRNLKIQPSKKKYETYLTEGQLKTVIDADVSHSKEFQHARNYIIISSFLGGLRIADMKNLHDVTVERVRHNSKFYDLVTTRIRKSQENNEELISTIPLLKPVRNLLALNNNQFPTFPSEQTLRKDIKKFLKHLKFDDAVTVKHNYYLVDEVEIKKEPQHTLFSPHDCRRTFITNLKQLGIQNDTIEPVTHPKIKYASVLDSYDKSTLVDKAVKMIGQLNSKKSSLFTY